jgi:hypothetical protein
LKIKINAKCHLWKISIKQIVFKRKTQVTQVQKKLKNIFETSTLVYFTLVYLNKKMLKNTIKVFLLYYYVNYNQTKNILNASEIASLLIKIL